MAFKPEWQGMMWPWRPPPPRRRHTWPTLFERQLFKMRPTFRLQPFVATGAPPRRRKWIEQLYPSIFFTSYKAIATVAWLPVLPQTVPLRLKRAWRFVSLFSPPDLLIASLSGAGTGATMSAEPFLLPVVAVRRRTWQRLMTPCWESGNLPKLGAKTKGH